MLVMQCLCNRLQIYFSSHRFGQPINNRCDFERPYRADLFAHHLNQFDGDGVVVAFDTSLEDDEADRNLAFDRICYSHDRTFGDIIGPMTPT